MATLIRHSTSTIVETPVRDTSYVWRWVDALTLAPLRLPLIEVPMPLAAAPVGPPRDAHDRHRPAGWPMRRPDVPPPTGAPGAPVVAWHLRVR